LQILSNLANDYGDYINGKDKPDRLGPARMVQSGNISPKTMLRAIILIVILTFTSGSLLIFSGTYGQGIIFKLLFFVLGIAAIVAAIKYTVGKKPYGYIGLGDISVFIFFGLIGVIGTYYLHTLSFKMSLFFPATSIGLLSAGVLNLNNIRDIESDTRSGKNTLVVLLGMPLAKMYHLFLITIAMLSMVIYTLLNFHSGFQFTFLFTLPLFIKNIYTVFTIKQTEKLNNELRFLALSTLLFTLCIGVGFNI
jgi:1,4-dihydroxy-2-naphthoate octaprenyltransferase